MPLIKKGLLLVGRGALIHTLRTLDAAMTLFMRPLAPGHVIQGSRTHEVPLPQTNESHRPHAFVTIATIRALAHCLSETYTQLEEAKYPASLEKRAQTPASLEKARACITIMHALLGNVEQDLQKVQEEQNIVPLLDQEQVNQVLMGLHDETSRFVDEYMIATFF